jgi:uroporphyrinogen-III synthase
LARAAEARDILPRELEALGFSVKEVKLYRTDLAAPRSIEKALAGEKADLATVTSASVAKGLAAGLSPETVAALPVVAIGPIAAQAAEEAGFRVAALSPVATLGSLAEAVVAYFQNG